jgi:hypothetical protein
MPSPTRELILHQGIEHEDVSKWTDDIGPRVTSRIQNSLRFACFEDACRKLEKLERSKLLMRGSASRIHPSCSFHLQLSVLKVD